MPEFDPAEPFAFGQVWRFSKTPWMLIGPKSGSVWYCLPLIEGPPIVLGMGGLSSDPKKRDSQWRRER